MVKVACGAEVLSMTKVNVQLITIVTLKVENQDALKSVPQAGHQNN